MNCFTVSSHADLKEAAVANVKGSARQLKNETLKKLKSHAPPLLKKLLNKSTDLQNIIDFEPGLGPKHRQPGSRRSGLSSRTLRAEESRYPSTHLHSYDPNCAFAQRPTWQKCVDVVFEVNHQYPQVLTCMGYWVILWSWACIMVLLMIQSRAPGGCSCA